VRDHSEGGAQSCHANRGSENHDGRLSRVRVHRAVVRRAISASRSRMTFTNVALRVIAGLRTTEFIARDYNEKMAWRGHGAVRLGNRASTPERGGRRIVRLSTWNES
jgi:hypothetical protein